MNVATMHNAVRILVDKVDSLNFVNLEPVEIDFFLNVSMERFIKHRADGGPTARNRGFEETQKRADDLRNITKNAVLTPDAISTDNKPNGRFVTLPSAPLDTYWFAINEEVSILTEGSCKAKVTSGNIKSGKTYLVKSGSIVYADTTYSAGSYFTGITGEVAGNAYEVKTFSGDGEVSETVVQRVEVKPLQHDDYNTANRDPFNKPVLTSQYKQVRRVYLGGKVEILMPDGAIDLKEYILRYIRKPKQISLTSSVDCELSDHTHQEIVDMAVSSILETIESGRYQTNLNELKKLE